MRRRSIRPSLFQPIELGEVVQATLAEVVRRYRSFNAKLDWHQRHCGYRCKSTCEYQCHEQPS